MKGKCVCVLWGECRPSLKPGEREGAHGPLSLSRLQESPSASPTRSGDSGEAERRHPAVSRCGLEAGGGEKNASPRCLPRKLQGQLGGAARLPAVPGPGLKAGGGEKSASPRCWPHKCLGGK
ncbi:Hypothetical predicted protein [Podarcis lilfordi]|uniref:Uncharacterized protein n=1 Tax=Podarcis lilfordi TaxID=74358 RepID=A0AA35NXY3_9SAUR|nr:Hypothetical predicted protein [Podarcis lilfordi]